jgi:hypothetical protein
VNCYGGTGTITLTATGGTTPYSFTVNGTTNTTGSYSGLVAGTYTYSINDAHGCGPVTGSVTITQPGATLAGSASHADVNCYGGTGTITLSATGGTLPYTFTVNGTTNTTGSYTGLVSGTYTYSITDANSCGPVTGSVTITQPALLALGSATHTDVMCNGGTGSITLSATGGTTPYHFTVNGTTNTTGSYTGLVSGTYTYSITDANGCGPVTGSVTITQPTLVTASVSSSGAQMCTSAPNNVITLTGTPGGGTTPYTVAWTGSGSPYVAPTNANNVTFSGAPSGVYTLTYTVTDAHGCSAGASKTITVYNPPIANAGPDQTINCGLTATLAATPVSPPPTGTWSVIGVPVGHVAADVTFSNINNPSAVITVPTYGMYTFQWYVSSNDPCPNVADTVVVWFGVYTAGSVPNNTPPSATAPTYDLRFVETQDNCGDNLDILVEVAGGTGTCQQAFDMWDANLVFTYSSNLALKTYASGRFTPVNFDNSAGISQNYRHMTVTLPDSLVNPQEVSINIAHNNTAGPFTTVSTLTGSACDTSSTVWTPVAYLHFTKVAPYGLYDMWWKWSPIGGAGNRTYVYMPPVDPPIISANGNQGVLLNPNSLCGLGDLDMTMKHGATAANLSGDATICKGQSTLLTVSITGGSRTCGPLFTVVLSPGNTSYSVASGGTISVSPMTTTTYTITHVYDCNGCDATGITGAPVVTVNTLTANFRVYLQGPWHSSIGAMDNWLDDHTTTPYDIYLPGSDPYGLSLSVSPNATTFFSNNSLVVDWVAVGLRATATGTTTWTAGLLTPSGWIGSNMNPNNALPLPAAVFGQSYYIVIYQRNHLGVMSRTPFIFNDCYVSLYDFTTDSTKAYRLGPNTTQPMVRLYNGVTQQYVWGMWAGDANTNGFVEATDWNSVWYPENGLIGYLWGDMNLDSSCDSYDTNTYWAPNLGYGSQALIPPLYLSY